MWVCFCPHPCVDIQFHRMCCWGSQESHRQFGLLITFERCELLILKRKKNYQLLLSCGKIFMVSASCYRHLCGNFLIIRNVYTNICKLSILFFHVCKKYCYNNLYTTPLIGIHSAYKKLQRCWSSVLVSLKCCFKSSALVHKTCVSFCVGFCFGFFFGFL